MIRRSWWYEILMLAECAAVASEAATGKDFPAVGWGRWLPKTQRRGHVGKYGTPAWAWLRASFHHSSQILAFRALLEPPFSNLHTFPLLAIPPPQPKAINHQPSPTLAVPVVAVIEI